MWKQLWKKWTLDKPAAFGDLLWEVFVVQLAAFLDRLTLRQVIAFIPVVILVLAYSHSIPIPPELMLVGDVLAYIDIYSAILLLGLMSRVTTILFVLKQAAAVMAGLARNMLAGLQRRDFRHRREGGARRQKKAASRTSNDDEPAVAYGLAWALWHALRSALKQPGAWAKAHLRRAHHSICIPSSKCWARFALPACLPLPQNIAHSVTANRPECEGYPVVRLIVERLFALTPAVAAVWRSSISGTRI